MTARRAIHALTLSAYVAFALGYVQIAGAAHLTYGWQAVDGINLFFREGAK